MDVLELPRPVINFLRTMAKESCRYALSWDIFGGPDSVTLTLTWKLIEDETQSSMINEATSPSSAKQQQQQQSYDNPQNRARSAIKDSNLSSSPRRSRRDENAVINESISTPAIFRPARGKSLEGSSSQSTKQIASHYQQSKEQQLVSSLERQTITNHHQQQQQQQQRQQSPPPPTSQLHQQQQSHRSKKEQQKQISTQSDQIYGNLYDTRSASVVKCATISSLSSSSPSPQLTNTNNPPLASAHTHHHRNKQQPSATPPAVRKPSRSLTSTPRTPTLPSINNASSSSSSTYAKLRRNNNNNLTTHNNDNNEDTLDPWVKRFECSFEDNDDDTTEYSEEKDALSSTTDNADTLGNTSGKVKFKTKPDYF